MSREARWLARELRPMPVVRVRPWWWRVLCFVGRHWLGLLLLAAAVWAWNASTERFGGLVTACAVAGLAGALGAWSRSRRWIVAAAGCAVTRWRLRAALGELRLGTRAGRLPFTVGIVPTPVGERVWLVCPVGVSAEDLADECARLRSACFAREVRVTRDRRWSALVVLDVVRRDPLGPDADVASDLPGGASW